MKIDPEKIAVTSIAAIKLFAKVLAIIIMLVLHPIDFPVYLWKGRRAMAGQQSLDDARKADRLARLRHPGRFSISG
jgi:hypothetical protein